MREGITARELIAALQQLDPDVTVWADGCDCTNPVTGVREPDEYDKSATIEVDA